MTPILFNYIQFRVAQFTRQLNHNGDFATIIGLGGLSVVLLNFNNFPILFAFPISLIHFRRRDIVFLKKIFPKLWYWIVGIEYTILYLTFIFANIHYKIGWDSLYIYSIIPLLTFIPPHSQSEYSVFKWNFIPNVLFEWKSFLREKTLLFFIYFIGLILSAYHPFTLTIMGIFYLDFISNAFKVNENKDLLLAFFRKNNFVEKLKYNTLFFNAKLVPTLIIYTILNYQRLEYLLCYILSMNLYLLLIISRKYNIYNHRAKENGYNSGVFMQYLISSIFVFPFIYFFKENYQNAQNKINSF